MAITWTQKTKAQIGTSGTTSINTTGSFVVEAPDSTYLYKTTDQGSNWTNIRDSTYNITMSISVDSDGSNIINSCTNGCYNYILRYSTNSGDNWSTYSTGIDAPWYDSCISSDGTVMIAPQYQNRIWMSVNSGASWSEIRPYYNSGYSWHDICCSDDGSVIYAGSYGGANLSHCLYVSTDSGANWTGIRATGEYYMSIKCSGDGSKIIVSIIGGRTYLSSNYGANWTEVYPTGSATNNYFKVDISSDGNVLIAAANTTAGRFWISTDGGSNWSETRPIDNNNHKWFPCLSRDGKKIWAGRSDASGSYSYYGEISSSSNTSNFFQLF